MRHSSLQRAAWKWVLNRLRGENPQSQAPLLRTKGTPESGRPAADWFASRGTGATIFQISLFNKINRVLLAETEGFEPSVPVTRYDDLANRCLQPLGHVSGRPRG